MVSTSTYSTHIASPHLHHVTFLLSSRLLIDSLIERPLDYFGSINMPSASLAAMMGSSDGVLSGESRVAGKSVLSVDQFFFFHSLYLTVYAIN